MDRLKLAILMLVERFVTTPGESMGVLGSIIQIPHGRPLKR
ncbi:unnamed protein product [Acidithrix sp. C25]|nr:unnamed protein product [Acidithrix sp. C25]